MKYSWVEIILHFIFWTATAWLLTGSFSVQLYEIEVVNGKESVKIIRSTGVMLQILTCIVIGALLFYTTTRLLQKNEIHRKTILYVLLVFGIGILLAYLTTRFQYLPNHPPLPKVIAYGMVTFYFAISITYSFAKLWTKNLQRQQQLLLDRKQTELALLRHHLQPHFLFNALNNLLSMVKQEENPKLSNSFEKLSQLLRFVIEETQSERVNIQKEILFLKNYIELQLLRFNENEVQVKFSLQGKFIEQNVEPGLFITFVENAFKYGTEPEKNAVIEICFDVSEEHTIYFEIKNTVMMQNIAGNGTGIETTLKRLALIYPNKHQLNIQETDEYLVNLKIQTQ